MASLQNTTPVHHMLSLNSPPSQVVQKQHGSSSRRSRGILLIVRAEHRPHASETDAPQVGLVRRQLVAAGTITPWVSLLNNVSSSFAAESKKGFLPVMDKKDGYQFFYPFGWQEVVIAGQDKVFKDVIEPLESVSVNLVPTNKQDIRDFGPPQQVGITLIKKVLAPPTQKTKLIQASEHEVDGKTYYTFEFVAKAPNYTRHALSTITVGNGKFYTLTTAANERRWGKMKDKLKEVVDSFVIFNV